MKLNTFLLSDYADRHFAWSRGTPLYALLKQHEGFDKPDDGDTVVQAMREAKTKIDQAA